MAVQARKTTTKTIIAIMNGGNDYIRTRNIISLKIIYKFAIMDYFMLHTFMIIKSIQY